MMNHRLLLILGLLLWATSIALAQFTSTNLTEDYPADAREIGLDDSGNAAIATDEGLFLYRNGELRLAIEDYGISEPHLNNVGQIAYVEAFEVYFVDTDGTRTRLSNQLTPPAGRSSLNNLGQVAFECDGEIYFFDGTFDVWGRPNVIQITQDFDPYAGRPSLNDAEQIAFRATEDGETHIYLADASGIRNISQSFQEDGRRRFTRPSLNNLGQIAFVRDVANEQTDILFFDGNSLINLSGEFEERLGFPILNDLGHVVCTNETRGGVMFFDGSDWITVTERRGDRSVVVSNLDLIGYGSGPDVYLARRGAGTPDPIPVEPELTDPELPVVVVHPLVTDPPTEPAPAEPGPEDPISHQEPGTAAELLSGDIQPSLFYPELNNLGEVVAHNASRGLFVYTGQTFEHRYTGKAGPSRLNDRGEILFEAQGTLYWFRSGQAEEIGFGSEASLNNVGQATFVRDGEVYLAHLGSDQIELLSGSLISPALNPSLNDLGQVAFATADGSIYLWDGFQLRNITAEAGLSGRFALPSLNAKGHIAFARETAVYLYDGAQASLVVSNVSPQVGWLVLNAHDQIVFDTEAGGELYLYADGDVQHLTIGFDPPAYRPSLNDRGQVTFYTVNPGEIYRIDPDVLLPAEEIPLSQETTPLPQEPSVHIPQEAALQSVLVNARIRLQGRQDHTSPLELVAIEASGEEVRRSLSSDGDGSFAVALPQGTYDLYLRAPGYLWASAGPVELNGASMDVSFRNGSENDPPGILLAGDLDGSNGVELADFAAFAVAFGSRQGDAHFLPAADIDADGSISLTDFSLIVLNFGRSGVMLRRAAPSQPYRTGNLQVIRERTPDGLTLHLSLDQTVAGYVVFLQFDARQVHWVPATGLFEQAPGQLVLLGRSASSAHFVGTNPDFSAVQLISAMGIRPDGEPVRLQSEPGVSSELLPNYPNPFNPETWIPYLLAEPGSVRITIHTLFGQLVRAFDLGRQPAGRYLSRDEALYWDGRNGAGERVSSGEYFCTLHVLGITRTRRITVMK